MILIIIDVYRDLFPRHIRDTMVRYVIRNQYGVLETKTTTNNQQGKSYHRAFCFLSLRPHYVVTHI